MKSLNAPRIASLDVVRGLIMVLMALDHARDFFHIDAFRFAPEDLQQSNLPLFFTRWITHLCAPLFLLLAGISISLYQEKKDTAAASSYVFFRGLWMVFLELTIVQFAWQFTIHTNHILGAVIWVIGWSMVLMAAFVYLPKMLSGIVALIILVLHNTLDALTFDQSVASQVGWSFLHVAAKTNINDQFFVFILYPLLPAFAVMLLGYVMGAWYSKNFPTQQRLNRLFLAGILCLSFFVFLRFTDGYGDMKQYAPQATATQSIISFFNVSKYPFSLHYCLATLGIGFLLLAFAEKVQGSISSVLATFGQVPMFYYILHLYFFHILSVLLFTVTNPESNEQWMPFGHRISIGYSLLIVYLIWSTSCIVFYFLCRRYGIYKKTHNNLFTKLI